ncbi:uncharacterized protein LOC110807677 isoform X2 [Carica papaya]|nr:uncharacterized protein LOC110807677 isoform X2 [Carica papaya]XP_021888556.1 uncharacterized protein LOC110807677 isoform X2 [Carica papaya]
MSLMDAKALAKSKRAHSLHHSKRPHPNQKLKAPSDGTSSGRNIKKPVGKEAGEKTRQSRHASALPSNWDRYEEEFDSGSVNSLGDSSNQPSDVIMPRSKGADFRHMIAEAQSQLHPYSNSSLSFDDVLPEEFKLGVGSLLSVRGEAILSWIGANSFIVEDETTASPEAAFLSLDLNALEEQLEKVDLPQRLFIEADLLPTELNTGPKGSSNQESNRFHKTQQSRVATRISEEVAADKKMDSACDSRYVDSLLMNPVVNLVNHMNNESTPNHFGESSESRPLESTAQFNVNSSAKTKKKHFMFESSAAEAELDMLLDSFSDSKISDAPRYKSENSLSHADKQASTSQSHSLREGPGSRRIASTTANFDDVVDDLLEQTSNLVNQNASPQPQEVKGFPHETKTSSHSVNKSRVLDDFASWLDTI